MGFSSCLDCGTSVSKWSTGQCRRCHGYKLGSNSTQEAKEWKARGGRNQPREAKVRGGRKAVESGQLASVCAKGGRVAGRKAVESGHLASISSKGGRIGGPIVARTFSHKRPTWPEVLFYGLVYGSGLSKGFTAQQNDGYGIYDGAWNNEKIVVELDGGGHHVFRDRHEDDAKKDFARRKEGFHVLRETDENVLFLKAFSILKG